MNTNHRKAFRRGLHEFNTERFFEAHEVCEEVWREWLDTVTPFLRQRY